MPDRLSHRPERDEIVEKVDEHRNSPTPITISGVTNGISDANRAVPAVRRASV